MLNRGTFLEASGNGHPINPHVGVCLPPTEGPTLSTLIFQRVRTPISMCAVLRLEAVPYGSPATKRPDNIDCAVRSTLIYVCSLFHT